MIFLFCVYSLFVPFYLVDVLETETTNLPNDITIAVESRKHLSCNGHCSLLTYVRTVCDHQTNQKKNISTHTKNAFRDFFFHQYHLIEHFAALFNPISFPIY